MTAFLLKQSYSVARENHEDCQGLWEFARILATSIDCNATDAKDFVYTFLGHPAAVVSRHSIDHEAETLVVTPGYKTKTVMQVYRETAVALFEKMQDLTLLSAVFHDEDTLRSNSNNNYPSWIPQWDHRDVTGSFSLGLDIRGGQYYNASDGIQRFKLEIVHERRLQTLGFVFDHIISSIKPNSRKLARAWPEMVNMTTQDEDQDLQRLRLHAHHCSEPLWMKI
jgi:hypothetical protein